ncbi:hypothetical protein RB601_008200 [Gaeumannomyces tritici]
MASTPDAAMVEKDAGKSSGETGKPSDGQVEILQDETLRAAAAHGHLATDIYGNPLLQFDQKAVRKLRLKMDLYLVPTVALLYLFCFIDRANIGNAKIAGLEKDLGMTGFDYNMVLSIFYISYIVFEIPATILCKWMGPGWFLPATSLLFGIVSITTAFCHTRDQLAGVRFLLGIFEAGMLPGIAYYLSRWYQRAELTFRLSLYMVMAPLAGAFGGLLASAILTLESFAGVHQWRMIFAIEGIVTIVLSVVAFFTLTDRPETARWMTEEEKILCAARVKSERVGQTEVLDRIDKKKLMAGMLNPVTLEIAVVFLFNNITVGGLAFFLPTIVSTIYPAYSTVQKQLYSVPPYIVGAFFTIAFPSLSWYLDRRQLLIAASAPMVMAGYVMFLASQVATVRYAATFLIASSAMVLGPMSNAHISANVVSDTARSSAIGLNVMFGNVGGLISTWSFLPWDAPHYKIGHGLNLAASSMILIVGLGAYFWMKWDNKRREGLDVETELADKTEAEIEDLDWRHPAFRWRP